MLFRYIIVVLLLSPISSFACDENGTAARGYWFYEECQKEEVEEEEEHPKNLPPLPAHSELMKKHPSEIRKMMEERLEHAIWTQSPEDTKNYYILTDVARRKSSGFSAVSKFVVMTNPELNPAAQYPLTESGRNLRKKKQLDDRRERFIKAGDNYALLMFSDVKCQYCFTQMNTLKLFQERYQWNIKIIEKSENPEMASTFNVAVTPYTFIIKKGTEKWMPVAVGAESLNQIEKGVHRAIRLLEGEITPQQYFTSEQYDGGYFDPSAKLGLQ